MSKKKSLGSSPIEFKSQKSAMGFIPDLGVSEKEQKSPQKEVTTISKTTQKKKEKKTKADSQDNAKKSKKKIVSYYLEIDLIEEVKSIADQKDMYYSSLVTVALKQWLAGHG
ncbi:MAG: hypothetical protein ACQEST_12020 [Bacteroidota bacterium]